MINVTGNQENHFFSFLAIWDCRGEYLDIFWQ
jgi:hypothetical protein